VKQIVLAAVVGVLALGGCGEIKQVANDAMRDPVIGRDVAREAANGKLDGWSDAEIDEAADEICDVIRKGKRVSARDALRLRDHPDFKGTDARTVGIITTYAKRYQCPSR
jgi:hypothetical protein